MRMADLLVVPAPNGSEGYVECARTPTSRVYRKQILHEGSFVHPGDPSSRITVNESFYALLKKNFDEGYCDTVQVPLVNDQNAHVEDPDRNIGQVVDLAYEKGKGVYALIEGRDERAQKLGKTYLGASAMLHLNYTDTRTGTKVGPTLLHVAVTNRPYITKLENYQEIVAASADMSGETPVVLTPAIEPAEEDKPMELDELLAELKDKHGVDVNALRESAEKADKSEQLVAAMSNVLTAASGGSGGNTPTSDEMTVEDVGRAVIELSQEKVTLARTVADQAKQLEELQLSATTAKAEAEVDGLVRAGKVLPKQRDAYVKLAVKDREMFQSLVPADAIVSLSETGVTTHESPAMPETEEQVKEAITRYEEIALSALQGKRTKK